MLACGLWCSHSAGEEGRPNRWADTVVEAFSDVPQHHARLADSCQHRSLLVITMPSPQEGSVSMCTRTWSKCIRSAIVLANHYIAFRGLNLHVMRVKGEGSGRSEVAVSVPRPQKFSWLYWYRVSTIVAFRQVDTLRPNIRLWLASFSMFTDLFTWSARLQNQAAFSQLQIVQWPI